MHFAFNKRGVKSRMRINYRVNDDPASEHLDGLCIPREMFLIKYESKGLAWGGGGGWALVMGTGGRID